MLDKLTDMVLKFSKFAFIFLAICFLSHTDLLAQDTAPPDYKLIKKTTRNVRLNYYYPNLLQRYITSDTSMSIKEKRYLYYGYVFHPSYRPFGKSKFQDSVDAILNRSKKTYYDYTRLINLSDSLLFENPFDLQALRNKISAHENQKDKESAKRVRNQYNIVMEAIQTSGDGKSKNSAFHVTFVSHERELMKTLNILSSQKSKSEDFYHVIPLDNDDWGSDKLYFNIEQVYESLNKRKK